MQPEDEGLVHNLILQRISRGAIYAGRGQFARLERSTFSWVTLPPPQSNPPRADTVYYCLVRSQAPEVTEAEQERGSFFSQEYVVCFWNEPESPQDSDTFELYPLMQPCIL